MTFRKETLSRIYQDAISNNDGFSLLGIDPHFPENDVKLSSMRIGPILNILEDFFDSSSMDSRVFLHSRMATTSYVGIAFNHGFDDREGRVIMHNGVLRTGKHHTVDSYLLADLGESNATGLRDSLRDIAESYANVFSIDTVTNVYSVVRMSVGFLYTDGLGNYSTNKLEDIDMPVVSNYARDYPMGKSEEPAQDVDEEFMDRDQSIAYEADRTPFDIDPLDPYEYLGNDDYLSMWDRYKYR